MRPDYIDPMFHSRVLGAKSRNLDTFFTDEETTRYLMKRGAEDTDISVVEGVMGYYDGLGGIDTKASAYDLAAVTKTPGSSDRGYSRYEPFPHWQRSKVFLPIRKRAISKV